MMCLKFTEHRLPYRLPRECSCAIGTTPLLLFFVYKTFDVSSGIPSGVCDFFVKIQPEIPNHRERFDFSRGKGFVRIPFIQG